MLLYSSSFLAVILVTIGYLKLATTARIAVEQQQEDPNDLGEVVPISDDVDKPGVACEILPRKKKLLEEKIPANVYRIIKTHALEQEYLHLLTDVLNAETRKKNYWKASSLYRELYLKNHVNAFATKSVSVYLVKKHNHGSKLPSTHKLCFVDRLLEPDYKPSHVYEYAPEKLQTMEDCRDGDSMDLAMSIALKAGGKLGGPYCQQVAGALSQGRKDAEFCKCANMSHVVFCGMHQATKKSNFIMKKVLFKKECHAFKAPGFSVTECGEASAIGDYQQTELIDDETMEGPRPTYYKGGTPFAKIYYDDSEQGWVLKIDSSIKFISNSQSKFVPVDGWRSTATEDSSSEQPEEQKPPRIVVPTSDEIGFIAYCAERACQEEDMM